MCDSLQKTFRYPSPDTGDIFKQTLEALDVRRTYVRAYVADYFVIAKTP